MRNEKQVIKGCDLLSIVFSAELHSLSEKAMEAKNINELNRVVYYMLTTSQRFANVVGAEAERLNIKL